MEWEDPEEDDFSMPLGWIHLAVTEHMGDASRPGIHFIERVVDKYFCCVGCYEKWLAEEYHAHCEGR